jgi:hypothetical protein
MAMGGNLFKYSIPEPNEQMIMFAQYDQETKTIIIE